MRVHPMARGHSSIISRVGIAATLMFFFQGRIRKDVQFSNRKDGSNESGSDREFRGCFGFGFY